jgi:transitional endoplasmic reticulum ATPase
MDGGMSLRLTVAGTGAEDAGRGIARIDPLGLAELGGGAGALLAVTGGRTAFVRALLHPPATKRDMLRIDATTRGNAAAAIGDSVGVMLAPPPAALRLVRLAGPSFIGPAMLRRVLAGVPLCAGDRIRLPLVDGHEAELLVTALEPDGPGLWDEATAIDLVAPPPDAAPRRDDGPRYEDIGGLARVVERVREVVEQPVRNRAVFAHLGITPPKGVLLVGPPGTGKTLIARAVAAETGAHFITINAPEIVDRFYGSSEQHLREVFEIARQQAPAIIFIDEIDAIAQKREALSGDKQAERRIVAQLLTLMDGLAGRGEVVVLAATNLPDGIDPALRRPGRFDREIRVDPPDRDGRREILAVHTRAMPLAADVNLAELAAATHGHVGADLAALCREAAMAALRRGGGLSGGAAPDLATLKVEGRDFQAALKEVTPSALREVFVEVPDIRWADVAGVDALRETLQRAVLLPLADPDRFARLGVRPPRGVLLHGRPGTGKTLIARALATEAQAGFISVRGPELLAEWQGASERALREVFSRARLASPCIIFFDEIDAIATSRGSGGGATVERMVAQLLTEMDGITQPGGLVVLAATNRPEVVDPALLRPGRFDLVLEITPPDTAARAAMLAVHVRPMPLAADVDLDALALATEGFVGADLAGMCRQAALAALARDAATADLHVTNADFAQALRDHAETRRGSNMSLHPMRLGPPGRRR